MTSNKETVKQLANQIENIELQRIETKQEESKHDDTIDLVTKATRNDNTPGDILRQLDELLDYIVVPDRNEDDKEITNYENATAQTLKSIKLLFANLLQHDGIVGIEISHELSTKCLTIIKEVSEYFDKYKTDYEKNKNNNAVKQDVADYFEKLETVRDTAALLLQVLFVHKRNRNCQNRRDLDLSDSYVFSLVKINEYIQLMDIYDIDEKTASIHFNTVSNRLKDIDDALPKDLYLFTFATIDSLFKYIINDNPNMNFHEWKDLQLLLEISHQYKSRYPSEYSDHKSLGVYGSVLAVSNINDNDIFMKYKIDFVTLRNFIDGFVNRSDEEESFGKIMAILTNEQSDLLLSSSDCKRFLNAVPDYKIIFEILLSSGKFMSSKTIEVAHNLNNTVLLLSVKAKNPHFLDFSNVLALSTTLLQIFTLISFIIVWMNNDYNWDNIYTKNVSMDGLIYITDEFVGNSTYLLHFNASNYRYSYMVIDNSNNISGTCPCENNDYKYTGTYSYNPISVTVINLVQAEAFCKNEYDTNVAACVDDKYDTWNRGEQKFNGCYPAINGPAINTCNQQDRFSCFDVDDNEGSWKFVPTLCDNPIWTYGINNSFNTTVYSKYIFIPIKLNWINANKFCANKYGTSLAVIFDEDGNDDAFVQCDENYGDCWIGASSVYDKESGVNKEFKWFEYPTREKRFDFENYNNWDQFSSKDFFKKIFMYIQKDLCAYISNNGSWEFTACNQDKYVLCNNPLWYTPWMYYYELEKDESILPSNWNNEILFNRVNIEATGISTIAMYGTLWHGNAPGEIYFFGIIATLILFAYFLRETTQLSELIDIISLANYNSTKIIGYIYYILSILLLLSAAMCSIALMVKSSSVVEVISSVISVLFLLDIDDWVAYFFKHKFNITSDFYKITTKIKGTVVHGKSRCLCWKIKVFSRCYWDEKGKQSCCVIAALTHAWSQIWFLQLWSVLLAYVINDYGYYDGLESWDADYGYYDGIKCDHSFDEHTTIIGWMSIITIGVWIVIFSYIDSTKLVFRGWIIVSFITGWLFLFIYTILVIRDCHIPALAKDDGVHNEKVAAMIIFYLGLFAILSGGIAGVVCCPVAFCYCCCVSYISGELFEGFG
eukprot:331835_1